MPALPDQYNKYCWRVSEADASLYWRYSAGVEKFLDYNHRYQRGEDYMMLGVDLALSHAVSSRDVLHAAGQAWATLRFTVPMIAGTTEITPEDDALLVYRVAPNSAAVEAWAERTVKLTKATTLEEARIEVDQLRPVIPDSQGDQTFLYVGPRGSPTDYAIILYGSHVPFDGVGYQTVMSRYLAILARYISDGKHETQDHSALQWGTEAQNLELPSFQVVSDGEPLEGPVFDNTLSQLNENMATLAHAHPFRSRKAPGGPDAPRRIERTMSKERTVQLVQWVRSKGLIVNHVVHAAVALLSLLDNSLRAQDALFATMGIYNARERLRPPYDKRLQYTGTATVVSALAVPVQIIHGIEDTGARLDIIAHALKDQYIQQRTLPAILGASATMVENFIPFLKSAPSGTDTGKIVARFAADGIGERNLDPDYLDATGALVFEIIDFFLCPRVTDSNAWFRAHSWRGQLRLSCDYNAAMLPKEAPEGFVNTVIELLINAASRT